MNKLTDILKNNGVRAILFFLSLMAFVWPFMARPLYQSVQAQYWHLFLAWAMAILLLYLISRAHAEHDDDPEA